MFPTKILVATDGSEEAVPALEAAVELANGTGSELQIVHVVSTKPEFLGITGDVSAPDVVTIR